MSAHRFQVGDHAAAIREALTRGRSAVVAEHVYEDALAALAALLAELEAAREEVERRFMQLAHVEGELEAARAREQQLVDLTEARRERIDFLVSELEAAREENAELNALAVRLQDEAEGLRGELEAARAARRERDAAKALIVEHHAVDGVAHLIGDRCVICERAALAAGGEG